MAILGLAESDLVCKLCIEDCLLVLLHNSLYEFLGCFDSRLVCHFLSLLTGFLGILLDIECILE